jgi:hypothetical protein
MYTEMFCNELQAVSLVYIRQPHRFIAYSSNQSTSGSHIDSYSFWGFIAYSSNQWYDQTYSNMSNEVFMHAGTPVKHYLTAYDYGPGSLHTFAYKNCVKRT